MRSPIVNFHEWELATSYCLICSKILNSLSHSQFNTCLLALYWIIEMILKSHTWISSFNLCTIKIRAWVFPFWGSPLFFLFYLFSAINCTFDVAYIDILNFWLYYYILLYYVINYYIIIIGLGLKEFTCCSYFYIYLSFETYLTNNNKCAFGSFKKCISELVDPEAPESM